MPLHSKRWCEINLIGLLCDYDSKAFAFRLGSRQGFTLEPTAQDADGIDPASVFTVYTGV
jgi:hypothetical protein